jgi:hypothetical protein
MDLFYAHLALRALLSLRERIAVSAIIVKAISLNRSQQPIEQAPAPSERLYNGPESYSLHIRVRAFTAFGDEAVGPRGDSGSAAPSRALAPHRNGNDGVTFQMRQKRYFQILTGSIFRKGTKL